MIFPASQPAYLAHFVVEKTLRLEHGFWACVADSAVFKTMDYIAGRRKPKAAERSEGLLKNCEPQLNDAEALVRIFKDTIEQGHAEDSQVLQQRLRDRLKRPGMKFRSFGAAEISEVYAAYKDMLANWQELPVGGELELRW